MIAVFLALVLACGEVVPVWSRDLGSRVSGASTATVSGRDFLVFQLADGGLRVLDAQSGQTVAMPAGLPRGLSSAGAGTDVLFVTRRQSLHALRLEPASDAESGPRFREAWTVMGEAGVARPRDDDPEFATHYLASAAALSGLLTIRSDGVVALFASDGAVRWRVQTPPPGAVRALGSHGSGALLAQSGGVARVWVLSGGDGPISTQEYTLEGGLPPWAALCGEELVCVWPDRGLLLRRGAATPFQPPGPGYFSIALLAAGQDGGRTWLWCGSETGGLARIEPLAVEWLRFEDSGRRPAVLRALAREAALLDRAGVLNVRDGAPPERFRVEARGDAIDVSLHGGLIVLDQVAAAGEGAGSVWLRRWRAANRDPAGSVARLELPGAPSLPPLWIDGRVVLVCGSRVAMFETADAPAASRPVDPPANSRSRSSPATAPDHPD